MDRHALQATVVAAAALLAFGVGAATVDDARETGPVLDHETATLTPGDGSDGVVKRPPHTSGCEDCGNETEERESSAPLGAVPRDGVLLLAAVASCVLGAYWVRAGRGDDAPGVPTAGTTSGLDEADGDGVGSRTAGIEQPAAEDPVSRAWRDAVARADGDRTGTRTPREHAAVARERGLDGAAVDALTDWFVRVRYGDEAVTDDLAARARAVARRIDDDAGEESDGDPRDRDSRDRDAPAEGSSPDGDGGENA